jgi:serine phosphatase RsbU (regulator of sigma subunit)
MGSFCVKAQGKKPIAKFSVSDTATIRSYLLKGTDHSSVNNDSAMYYADLAESGSQQIKNESLLAQAFFLKAKINYFTANYSAAQFYQYKSLLLAEKVKDKKLMSKSYNLAGAICFSIGNYDEAVKQYNNRLILSQQEKDTGAILQGYFNLSLVYNTKGEHRSAVEVNYKALDLAEKSKDTINLMAVSEGLGMSYFQLGELDRARPYLDKAYAIALLKNQTYEQGGILIDIGNIHQAKKEHKRAINFYNKAIEITSRNGDKRRESIAISNKAKSLMELKDLKHALSLYDEALKINLEINYAKGLSDVMANKAECLVLTGDLKEAEKLALQAKDIARNIKAPKEEGSCYKLLEGIYLKLGDKAKAYEAYKNHIMLRDSAEEKAGLKTISGIEFNYDKEKSEREAKFKEERAKAEVKRQRQVSNLLLAAGVILFVLLVFVLRVYFQKRKANEEIIRQNKILEETNRHILESINYSRGIQESILPSREAVAKLLPESFFLYRPKDIVSGDFYFVEEIKTQTQEMTAVALADCTGHGVPGALMSLMGHSILKQCIPVKEVKDPGSGLDYLNKELHSVLRQNQKEEHILDGMDIAFCTIDSRDQKLSYAGANNPVWIISKKKDLHEQDKSAITLLSQNHENCLYEIKATKQAIGFNENPRPFQNHELKLMKGDIVYLFTDGYADQFGGPKGKKYKYKQLSELILSNGNKSLSEQRSALEHSFHKWKGNLEQVDDVSIIGIKL